MLSHVRYLLAGAQRSVGLALQHPCSLAIEAWQVCSTMQHDR